MHIDNWIDDEKNDAYARDWFEKFRRPAVDKIKEPDERLLFCMWKGKRWRVTGCSRMGDVWLAKPGYQGESYEHRVDVAECSEWTTIR